MLKIRLEIPRSEAGMARINGAREYVGRDVLLQLHKLGEIAANPRGAGLEQDDTVLFAEWEIDMTQAAQAK